MALNYFTTYLAKLQLVKIPHEMHFLQFVTKDERDKVEDLPGVSVSAQEMANSHTQFLLYIAKLEKMPLVKMWGSF